MSASANPDIVTNGLVFGFDTGYPFVSESHETFRYNRGEPTTTFDIGTMVPTNPNTYFTSNATYHSNLHGTVWDWSYYPNSNISADGGMEWVPNYEGPGFTGAWKMKKRAGGNSESNFSGAPPGSIDSTKTYTVSVWCKTDQASMARIHVNTTKDGSSYWGYASSYHSGGGGWERLSVTIPAGAGNTSLNTIRCQCLGTSTNADSYWRDYQVEERSHATPFILGGTRSATGSLIDLTGTSNIDVSNASFDSNAQMTFDGTDDYLDCGNMGISSSKVTFAAWIKFSGSSTEHIIDASGNSCHLAILSGNKPYFYNGSTYHTDADAITNGVWYYLTGVQSDTNDIYINGVLSSSKNSDRNISVSNVNIGRWQNGGRYFNGDIASVRIYNRALTAAEVLQNYNATKSRFV